MRDSYTTATLPTEAEKRSNRLSAWGERHLTDDQQSTLNSILSDIKTYDNEKSISEWGKKNRKHLPDAFDGKLLKLKDSINPTTKKTDQSTRNWYSLRSQLYGTLLHSNQSLYDTERSKQARSKARSLRAKGGVAKYSSGDDCDGVNDPESEKSGWSKIGSQPSKRTGSTMDGSRRLQDESTVGTSRKSSTGSTGVRFLDQTNATQSGEPTASTRTSVGKTGPSRKRFTLKTQPTTAQSAVRSRPPALTGTTCASEFDNDRPSSAWTSRSAITA